MMSTQGLFETEIKGCQWTHSKTPSIHDVHSIMGRRNKRAKNLNFPCYKDFGCTFSSDSQKGLSLHQNRCNAIDKKMAAAAAAIKSSRATSQASNAQVARPNLPVTELSTKRSRDNSTVQRRDKRQRLEAEDEVSERAQPRASTSRDEILSLGTPDDDMGTSSRRASPVRGWQDPSDFDMDWAVVSCKMCVCQFLVNVIAGE